MRITLFIGPSASKKTERMLQELEAVHRIDPFSYFFVGPSGDHVRYVRESFISRVGTIPASRFLAMDQFAVELFSALNPASIHVGNHLIRMEIGDILDQIGREELADSPVFVDYLLQMVHDVKENGGFEEIFSEDDEVSAILESIYVELQKRLSKKGIFDTFDAYTQIDDCERDLRSGEFGRNLFLDGFHDFSHALKHFFKAVIPAYDEVFITVPQEPGKEFLFSNIDSILETVDEIGENLPELEIRRIFFEKTSPSSEFESFKDSLFSSSSGKHACGSVDVVVYPDIFAEIEGISRFVKSLLISGYEPGDISVVASDFFAYRKLLSGKLLEYGVPSRIEGDEQLYSSLSIRRLILPLETAVLGFPPDKIIAMGDCGYGGEIDSRFLESVSSMSRIIYERAGLRLSHQKRRLSWLEHLGRLVHHIEARREAIISLAEDELELSAAEELAGIVERIKGDLLPAIEKIFAVLEPLKSLRKRAVGSYREMLIAWERELSLTDTFSEYKDDLQEQEFAAVRRLFDHTLTDLERLLKFMGKELISPHEYYRYLILVLRHDKFPLSRSKANRVEVQSLINSRFSKKKIKLFAGFVDGAYPHVSLNPLYSFTQFGEIKPRDLLLDEEIHQRLNLHISVSSALESVRFTLPESTVDGEPILPSPYLKSVLESSGGEIVREGRKAGRRFGYIPELGSSMSESELKIAAARLFRSEAWNELKEFGPLKPLDSVLSHFGRELSWSVENTGDLRRIVGKVFSFSRLKSYYDCPFSFFLSYVVGLDVPLERIFELTALDEGNIFHSVLRDFFSGKNRDWQSSLSENISRHLMHDSKVVFRFEYERLKEILRDYITERESRKPNFMQGDFVPFAFEKAFGIGDTKPVELQSDFFLRGKIDRLDLDESSRAMYLIDYKRGDSGDEKQLLLYSIVADRLFQEEGYYVAGGVFKTLIGRAVNKSAFRTISSDEDRSWEFANKRKAERIVRESQLFQWLGKITEGVYSGRFPPSFIRSSNQCYNCKFATVKRAITWREGESDSE